MTSWDKGALSNTWAQSSMAQDHRTPLCQHATTTPWNPSGHHLCVPPFRYSGLSANSLESCVSGAGSLGTTCLTLPCQQAVG